MCQEPIPEGLTSNFDDEQCITRASPGTVTPSPLKSEYAGQDHQVFDSHGVLRAGTAPS
jgi:hypothetical protein